MAGERTRETTVELTDDGTISIDVGDLEIPGEEGTPVVKAESVAPKPAAADEAADSLKKAMEAAEAGRRAAEAQAASERRRADEAQRLADERAQEAQRWRGTAEGHESTIITSGLAAAEQQRDAAKRDYVAAMEAGDFAKAADAQGALAEAAAAIDRLKDAKTQIDAGTRRVATTEGRVEARPAPNDAVERYLGNMGPRAASWIRQHPECLPPNLGGDAAKHEAMLRGHYAAQAAGYADHNGAILDSDKYFQSIEEKTGYRQPVSAAAETTPAGDVEAVPAQRQRRAAPVAAPVSRDAPAQAGSPSNQRSIRLTKEEQEAAEISFGPYKSEKHKQESLAKYARNKLELLAENKLGRTTH